MSRAWRAGVCFCLFAILAAASEVNSQDIDLNPLADKFCEVSGDPESRAVQSACSALGTWSNHTCKGAPRNW